MKSYPKRAPKSWLSGLPVLLLSLLPLLGFGQTTIFSSAGGGTFPGGWTSANNVTTTAIDQGTYYLVEAGAPSDIIITASYDLSAYSSASLSLDVATFGSGGNNSAKVEISYNGGTTYTQTATTATPTSSSYLSSSVALSGALTTTVRIRISNNGSAGRGVRLRNLLLTASAAPTLTVGALTPAGALNTVVPTASSAASYLLSGANLTAGVTLTPPTGFEVSQTSATAGFAGEATALPVSQADATAGKTIFVRLSGAAAGSFGGSVTHASAGATTRTVAVSGKVLPAAPTQQPGVAASAIGSTSLTLTLSGGNGTSRLLVVRTLAAAIAPATATTYAANSVYGTGATTGAGNFVVVADGTTGALTVSGLLPGTGYVAEAYAYNDNATAGFENYLSAAPGAVIFSTAAGAALSVNPGSLGLGTTGVNTPGVISTYTLTGSGLSADVTITPPAGVEVSSDGFLTTANSSPTSLTVSAAAVTGGATIAVRLAAGAAGGISGNITNASPGTSPQNVAVSGTVVANTASACLGEGFESTTFPPTGWVRSGSSDVTRSTAVADVNDGVAAAIFGANTGTLTTPQLANPSALSFFLGVSNNTNPKQFEVRVSTTSPSGGFTTVQVYSHNTTGGVVLTGGTYNQYTVDLSAYNGVPAVWVQFAKTNSSTTSPFRFDDVAVTCGTAAPPLTIATSTSLAAGPYCVGQGSPTLLSVPFTVSNGSFGAGNVFTAYLSNDNFVSNRLAVGTLSGASGGTIGASIGQVAGLTSGAAYRVRVEGSAPATATYTDNGTNLTVSSYLDNEVSAATATTGNGQATLSFSGPATCVTNVLVTLEAGSGFTGKPAAGSSYAASAAFGAGTALNPGQFVVYNGPATGSVTVTGLTNNTRYAFGIFTTNGGSTGASGYSNGATRTVTPVVPAVVTEVFVPRYLSGRPATGSTHQTRLPYVWRATLSGLLPNTTYKYYAAARALADPATFGGVGISLETTTAGAFKRAATPGLSASSSTFTTDASGTYGGWFGLEPSGDARFIDQAVVFPMVVINAGDGSNSANQFLATASPVTALLLGTGASQATGVSGGSFGTASNFVLTYDNAGGGGRPLAGTFIESDGLTESANYVGFYGSGVDGQAGRYGLLTPNANASGIRRVEQRALADGALLSCPATDADGTWPGGANTASPSGGPTPLLLTTGDTPLAAPTVTGLGSASRQPGQTLTTTGTGFAAAPNATVTFAGGATATAATVSAAGTSLTVVVPAAAQTGPVTVSNACGPSSPSASLTIVPFVFYTVSGAADLSQLSSFTANSDGSAGTTPFNFTTAGQTFNILGMGRTFGSNWTVSGSGSKVIITAGASLVVPPTFTYTGTLDQAAGSTLILQNPGAAAVSSLNQGAQDPTSTIDLAQPGGVYTVPTSLTYQNLKLTGGQKRLGGNSAAPLLVAGNLTFDGTLVSGSNLNSSGDTPGDYPTFAFGGSFVQLSSTTYDPARSVVFRPTGTGGPQTLDAGGGTIQLYDVFSPSGSNVSGFRLVGNGSVLMLGNAFDGGFALSDASTVLALDAGTTLRLSGGGRFFSTASGLLQPDPGANIELLRAGNGVAGLGTLPLDPAFTTVNNLLLNATAPLAAANTLLLSTDLMVSGATNLQSGALALGGNQLFVNGPLSVLNGSVTGSATSSLSLGGTAGALNALRFTSGGQTLRNLTLSRALAADVAELPLASPLSVGGALTLTNGVLTTSAPTLLTLTQGATVVGGSAASFVNGPLARAAATAGPGLVFPIGKGGNYRPLTLGISSQSGPTTYQAEQFEGDALVPGVGLTGSLSRVSKVRYFTLTPSPVFGGPPTGFNGTVTLSFDVNDAVNAPNDPGFVVGERTDATQPWFNAGNFVTTGGPARGPGARAYQARLPATRLLRWATSRWPPPTAIRRSIRCRCSSLVSRPPAPLPAPKCGCAGPRPRS